jgi:hypothetical protein
MNRPCWSTAATGSSHAGGPLEVAAQYEHLQRCQNQSGRSFAWRCGTETVRAFVQARFVTTVLGLLVFLAGAAWLVL